MMAGAAMSEEARSILSDANTIKLHSEAAISKLLVFMDKLSRLKRANFAEIDTSKSEADDLALIKHLEAALDVPKRVAKAVGSLEACAAESSVPIGADDVSFSPQAAYYHACNCYFNAFAMCDSVLVRV
jgi:hypothetical protein